MSAHGCSAIGVVRRSEVGCVTVELAPPPRCQGCTGACLWYRVPPSEHLTLPATSSIPVGTTVVVTLPDRYLLAGATVVYVLPLGALLAGAATAAAIFGSDWAAAAGGAVALLLALLAASPLRRWLERATLRHLAVQRFA
jgi:positive regulator of sigma E activity